MTTRVIILTAICLACGGGAALVVWTSWRSEPPAAPRPNPFNVPWVKSADGASPESLAALSAPELRGRLADKQATPEARAQAIFQIARLQDWDSVEVLIAQLDDSSRLVRGKAAAALRHILGTEFFYRAEDERPRRLQSIQNLRRYWDARKGSPPLREKSS